jgi:cell shape-determining protein MreD
MTRDVRWGFWLFIAILVVLHFVLRIGLGFEQLAPDLLVVALLLAAREMRAGWAAGLGLLLGILDGSVTPYSLGASALVLTVLGFLGARSRDLFAGDNFLLLAAYLFAGKWLFDALLYLITGSIFHPGASYLLLVSPLAALYAVAAGLVTLAAYRALT